MDPKIDEIRNVTHNDLDALWEYVDGRARELTGMSYADGIQEMLEWLQGWAKRPDFESACD